MLNSNHSLFISFLLSIACLDASDTSSSIELFVDHFEDANDAHSETGGFSWKKQWTETINTTWDHSFDAVSGASRTYGLDLDGKSGATFGKPHYPKEMPEIINGLEEAWYKIHGASGATTDEIRLAEGLSLGYEKEGTVYGAGFHLSEERDYSSYSFSLNTGRDFLNRNLSVGISHSQFFDDFHPFDSFEVEGNGKKRIANTSLELTQLLSPNSYVNGSISHSYAWGYLGHPYYPVTTIDSTSISEKLPDSKTSASFFLQFVNGFTLWEKLAVARINYRYYVDSWGLNAHSTEVQFSRYFAEWISSRLRLRYHWQSDADFAQKTYKGTEKYRTADIRFYNFHSLLGGIQFAGLFPASWEQSAWLPDEWEIKWDHLWRNTKGDVKLFQLYSPNQYYTQNEFMVLLRFLF